MGAINWLPTAGMAKRVGVGVWFFANWIRSSSRAGYPEKLKPKMSIHYLAKKGSAGHGGRQLFWNPETITPELVGKIRAEARRRRGRGLKSDGRKDRPEPKNAGVEIFCPWRGIYMSLEHCQRCWISKAESERPDGYQWEEHCQRGVSVEEWEESS